MYFKKLGGNVQFLPFFLHKWGKMSIFANVFPEGNINMITLSNVETQEEEVNSSCIGLAPDAIPSAKSSRNGVSVEYTHDASKKWFVFRASYGREDKAYDFIVEDGVYAYIAKREVIKDVHGKRRKMLEPLIPNLIFVYTTDETAYQYAKSTPELSYLSFYYNHFEITDDHKNPPLTIPYKEMENFIKATSTHDKHLLFVDPAKCHFKSGELVRVVDGAFIGVEGRVARVSGQQRVIVNLSEIGLVSTAYIPSAFIEKIEY